MSAYKGLLSLSLSPKPRVCVESGTYQGESALLFTEYFGHVHTIELSPKWYDYSRERLKDRENITCHFGDSAVVLKDLTKQIEEPVFYYLDAHFAGGDTAFGDKEVPLVEELTEIAARPYADVIVIDDMRLVGKAGVSGDDGNLIYSKMEYDWRDITLDKIAEITGRGLRNAWFFKGDRLVIFRNRSLLSGTLLRFWIIFGRTIDYGLVKPIKKVINLFRRKK